MVTENPMETLKPGSPVLHRQHGIYNVCENPVYRLLRFNARRL